MTRLDLFFMLALTAAVDGLTLWSIFAEEYPPEAALFPGLAAGALTLLAFARVVHTARGGFAMAGGSGQPDAPPGHDRDEAKALVRSDLGAGLWILAALPLAYLLGYQVGLPLHALSYQIAHGVRPAKAVAVSALIALLIWTLFGQVLGLHLPRGMVAESLL